MVLWTPVAWGRSPCAPSDDFELWTSSRLWGFNLWMAHESSWESSGPLHYTYTEDSLRELATLGANYVQISHPGLFGLRPPYGLNPQAQSSLDGLIDMAGRAGLYAVVAFRTGPGRNEYAFRYQRSYDPQFDERLDEHFWDDPNAQSAWVEMMRYTAERYRDNPVVIGYDPLVEPNYVAQVPGYPGPDELRRLIGGTIHDWNLLAARITAAVRGADPGTPVLLEPEGYGNAAYLSILEPTGDPRTVYTAHFYEPFAFTHQSELDLVVYPGPMNEFGEAILADSTFLRERLRPLAEFKAAHGVPVAVTEMGTRRWGIGGVLYLSDVFDVLESTGAGYAQWRAPPDPYDAFDIRKGSVFANHTDVPNELQLEVMRRFAANCRPGS